MNASSRANFDQNYQRHLNHLKLKGLQPKTIDAYSRAIRRVGERFEHQIDQMNEQQLLTYYELLWRGPKPVEGSSHIFKYRLVYVVDGVCVLRYDNESGKGDHRYINNKERAYKFSTPDQLITDFQHDIARWNRENHNS